MTWQWGEGIAPHGVVANLLLSSSHYAKIRLVKEKQNNKGKIHTKRSAPSPIPGQHIGVASFLLAFAWLVSWALFLVVVIVVVGVVRCEGARKGREGCPPYMPWTRRHRRPLWWWWLSAASFRAWLSLGVAAVPCRSHVSRPRCRSCLLRGSPVVSGKLIKLVKEKEQIYQRAQEALPPKPCTSRLRTIPLLSLLSSPSLSGPSHHSPLLSPSSFAVSLVLWSRLPPPSSFLAVVACGVACPLESSSPTLVVPWSSSLLGFPGGPWVIPWGSCSRYHPV